jgi:hypothetical protein
MIIDDETKVTSHETITDMKLFTFGIPNFVFRSSKFASLSVKNYLSRALPFNNSSAKGNLRGIPCFHLK